MNTIGFTPNVIGANVEQLNGQTADTDERVAELAQEFEGIFLSLLTKELRETLEGGGLFGEETSDAYGGMFDMFMGQHLASSQPLGIASLWIDQYEQNSNNQTESTNSLSKTA